MFFEFQKEGGLISKTLTLGVPPTPTTSPLLALEALWRVRAQAIPLGLIVVHTSQRLQPGSMVQSAAGTKLQALTVEAEHYSQTLLMCCCTFAKRGEKHCQNFAHCPRYKAAFYITVIN